MEACDLDLVLVVLTPQYLKSLKSLFRALGSRLGAPTRFGLEPAMHPIKPVFA